MKNRTKNEEPFTLKEKRFTLKGVGAEFLSIPFLLARDFAHLARPQVRAEHRRTVVRRASATGREHRQGAKLPLKTGGVLRYVED